MFTNIFIEEINILHFVLNKIIFIFNFSEKIILLKCNWDTCESVRAVSQDIGKYKYKFKKSHNEKYNTLHTKISIYAS